MNVAITLSPWDCDVVLFDLDFPEIAGATHEFVSGTTRAFQSTDDTTDGGTHRDVSGGAP